MKRIMKKGIAVVICSMLVLLAGCSSNTVEVTLPLGEIGTLNAESLMKPQDGIKGLSHNDDTLTVTVAKDGNYSFYVTDEKGKDIEVIMTVEKGEVSVKTKDGADVSFTVKK